MPKIHLVLSLICLWIGISGLYVIAEFFDPQATPIYATGKYVDKTVLISGKPIDMTYYNTSTSYVRGKIIGNCSLPFIYFSADEVFEQDSLFIGTVQQQYSKNTGKVGVELLVEEIK